MEEDPEETAADSGVTLLRKQGWYLGELSEGAASDILQSCNELNVFIVYKTPSNDYVLSARFPVDGSAGLVEHLPILQLTDTDQYQLTGQADSYPSIVEAVNSYTTLREPPLSPALGEKKQLEAQLSIASISAPPPAYDEANRRLQPDIAPLPKIDNIQAEAASEAKAGRISPSGSFRHRYDSYNDYRRDRSSTPVHMHNPHWWRYRDKSCCHPKNVCHCCCYRETYWNGYRERPEHKWYNCKETGFLRCLLLILMWCIIWPCVGIGFCIAGCVCLCFFACCYEDDD